MLSKGSESPAAEACASRAPTRPTAEPSLASPESSLLPTFLYFEQMKDFHSFLCAFFF